MGLLVLLYNPKNTIVRQFRKNDFTNICNNISLHGYMKKLDSKYNFAAKFAITILKVVQAWFDVDT